MDLGEESSSVISAAAGIVIHVLLALLFLFSSVANVLVLVIFYRKPALRSLSNRFVMSLLLFNLVATLVLLPLMVIDSLIDAQSYELSSSYDYAVCTAGQAVTTLVTTGSISAALVIAVDQYCAVMAPLHYHRRVTKVKAWLLLAGQWLLAAALSAFSLPDSAGKRFWKGCAVAAVLPSSSINGSIVTDDDESLIPMMNETTTMTTTEGSSFRQRAEEDIWTLLFVSSSVICYVVPLALLTWMYLRIYSAAHRNSQRTRRTSLTHSASELVVHCLGHHHHGHHGHHGHGQQQQQSPPSSISGSMIQVSQTGTTMALNQQQQTESPCSTLPSRTPSLRSTSSQIVHNLRYRISNASLFLYREEARAARVSVFVLVLVVCCWMPYHVLLALSGWSAPITGHQAIVPAYAYRLGLVAVLLNALASPFLYAYRSRRIQREVRRLFGLPPKSGKKRTGKAVGLHRELTNSSSGQCGHHKRRGGPLGQKSLRSLSPRRQLLRKQVRQGVCVSEAVSSTFEEVIGSSASGTVTAVHLGSTDHHRFGRFFSRMTTRLLWRSKGPGVAVHQSGLDGHQSTNTCPLLPSAVPAAAAVTGELMRQQAISAVTRSSFSSATSSNSTSSAESDVSL